MHADNIAFPKRSDLEIFTLAAGFLDYALDGESGSRGCIFLESVVPLEDLSGVFMPQGFSCGAGDVEEKIHSYRKVGRVNQSSTVAFDQLSYPTHFSVPSSRADHHVLAGLDAGFDIGDNAGRGGEIDYYISPL